MSRLDAERCSLSPRCWPLRASPASSSTTRTRNRAGLVFPSAVAIDLKPGTTSVQRARLVNRIVSANPTNFSRRHLPADRRAGLSRHQCRAHGRSAARPRAWPGRRRGALAGPYSAQPDPAGVQELALLKTLGMTRGQVRAVVAWQTTLALTTAVIVGGPLGVVAGRWAWRAFANSLGIAPVLGDSGPSAGTGTARAGGGGQPAQGPSQRPLPPIPHPRRP